MYAREEGNKVILLCKAPSFKNLNVYWTEVQEYMDKGYRYKLSDNFKEGPMSMGMIRVTLYKVDLIGEETSIEETIVEETPVEEIKVEKVETKKTSPKKTANKKSTNKKG